MELEDEAVEVYESIEHAAAAIQKKKLGSPILPADIKLLNTLIRKIQRFERHVENAGYLDDRAEDLTIDLDDGGKTAINELFEHVSSNVTWSHTTAEIAEEMIGFFIY